MAKTKALISFAVTAKLICVFVFAYAKSRFSHDAAQLVIYISDTKTTHSLQYLQIMHSSKFSNFENKVNYIKAKEIPQKTAIRTVI